jgi:hypothetical protein
MPASIGGSLDYAVTQIGYKGTPQLAMAFSTDPAFTLRPKHADKLKLLRAGAHWQYADTRDDALARMKEGTAHLFYFYCHGGVTKFGYPYIEVGPPGKAGGSITNALLKTHKIFWHDTRPLVIINGCHTTALEPETIFNMVDGLVKRNAAGVIGTEVTIFEPLAVAFAEECLHHFLNGEPIGEAVRLARLKLLEDRNPLGLVYDLYALASLRMVEVPQ